MPTRNVHDLASVRRSGDAACLFCSFGTISGTHGRTSFAFATVMFGCSCLATFWKDKICSTSQMCLEAVCMCSAFILMRSSRLLGCCLRNRSQWAEAMEGPTSRLRANRASHTCFINGWICSSGTFAVVLPHSVDAQRPSLKEESFVVSLNVPAPCRLLTFSTKYVHLQQLLQAQ